MKQVKTRTKNEQPKTDQTEERDYEIFWEQFESKAFIQLQFGIKKKEVPLKPPAECPKHEIRLQSADAAQGIKYVEISGRWTNLDDENPYQSGSILKLKLKNIHHKMLCLNRLMFPVENGLDKFLGHYSSREVSFLQNGYQSWSPVRSYRLNETPMRSWFYYVLLMTTNMSNLHSNRPGYLSSEMYTVITNNVLKDGRNSFFIGQTAPFNQLFYILFSFHPSKCKKSHFQIIFDFGKKLLKPGEEIELDGIYLARGQAVQLLNDYFHHLKKESAISIPRQSTNGWCTWYCYGTKIDPDCIYKNLSILKKEKIKLDYVQIDDGYETIVGDWLDLKPAFIGKMKDITAAIKAAGYKPAIWLAPFIADRRSKRAAEYPNLLMRSDKGKRVLAGENPDWLGMRYYTLDILHPLYEEYLREVITTFVHEWGFEFLKLDFLYAISIEDACPLIWKKSRAEIFKYGIDIIRQAAGPRVKLLGCGAPLSPSIDKFECMRVGMDTAPFWVHLADIVFMTGGSILGVKNNLRNTLVRSFMNKKLWVNDPDCIMVRKKKTSLSPAQRQTDINGKLLAGGLTLFSDDLSTLAEQELDEMHKIIALSKELYQGESVALDIMERPIPQILYNTKGYIGFFNFSLFKQTHVIDLSRYSLLPRQIKGFTDVWTGKRVPAGQAELNGNNTLKLPNMQPYSSYLFKIVT